MSKPKRASSSRSSGPRKRSRPSESLRNLSLSDFGISLGDDVPQAKISLNQFSADRPTTTPSQAFSSYATLLRQSKKSILKRKSMRLMGSGVTPSKRRWNKELTRAGGCDGGPGGTWLLISRFVIANRHQNRPMLDWVAFNARPGCVRVVQEATASTAAETVAPWNCSAKPAVLMTLAGPWIELSGWTSFFYERISLQSLCLRVQTGHGDVHTNGIHTLTVDFCERPRSVEHEPWAQLMLTELYPATAIQINLAPPICLSLGRYIQLSRLFIRLRGGAQIFF
ncbi:hypothetical protein EV360DRAFT_88434 [Lentinula raphanica]|nr:hypothetical protein EV360DRAFT_88434 [Lentinula raphanica]